MMPLSQKSISPPVTKLTTYLITFIPLKTFQQRQTHFEILQNTITNISTSQVFKHSILMAISALIVLVNHG